MIDFNRVMVWVLGSPFHRLISGSMLVLGLTGMKSGNHYNVPVSYTSVETQDGLRLLVTSQRDRTWWRNVRDRVGVGLILRGQNVSAFAQAREDQGDVADGFKRYFKASPGSARFFSIELTTDGKVDEKDLMRLAQERVIVWIEPVEAKA
jgi:hypothetical protein